MKMVVGVVRTTSLERIVHELGKIEINNLTISEVKGIGEQITLFDAYVIHNVILAIVPDEKAEPAANLILEFARTGSAGDGIVAVCPVDYMIKIRTMERLE